MKYTMFDKPIKVYGIHDFDKTHVIERLPKALREELNLVRLGERTPSARLGFRTDAAEFTVTVEVEVMHIDRGMAIYACQSANVYVGRGKDARFVGLVPPTGYDQTVTTATFKKSGEMEDIFILLPRNENIVNVTIELPDGAAVEPPTPYHYERPVLFLGSSITEGGCCASLSNAYTALLSKWLDVDYYNYGLSGSCRGQLELADFFAGFDDISVFVLDYDHNSPSAEHLARTHEPFFRRLREHFPDLPVLMMTAPNYRHIGEADERRAIIRKTYDNAVAAGDKNVYFVDGKDFFGDEDVYNCTVDMIHPNDLGMYRMAKCVYPVLKKILEKTEN